MPKKGKFAYRCLGKGKYQRKTLSTGKIIKIRTLPRMPWNTQHKILVLKRWVVV